MMNYSTDNVHLPRYFAGFILISLAHALGRPAIIKQLSKTTGTTLFSSYNTSINLYECLGALLGIVWGVSVLLSNASLFVALIVPLLLNLFLMLLALLRLNSLLMPHWSYQVERQEAVLKYLARNKGFYESLDSREQTRELPVYVGNTYNQNDTSSYYYHTNHTAKQMNTNVSAEFDI